MLAGGRHAAVWTGVTCLRATVHASLLLGRRYGWRRQVPLISQRLARYQAATPRWHRAALRYVTMHKAATARRLTAIRLRICSWSKFDLSYLGRVHVAKQVLASSLYFHASFLLPSEAQLKAVVACIDRFVALGCLVEGPVGPLAHLPGQAVESLPWDMGGLQRADVHAQVQALQAKVAAMLLHPRRRSWKPLLRRAFERYVRACLGLCGAGQQPGACGGSR